MGEPEVLSKYSLPQHPFNANEPLDPAKRPADANVVVQIDGWREGMPGLDQYLSKHGSDQAGTVFIHGCSGSGRTSMANHTIQAWQQHHHPPASGQPVKVIACRKVLGANHDTEAILREWALNFEFELATVSPKVVLSATVQDKFAKLGSSVADSTTLYLVKTLLLALSKELALGGLLLAGVFERINNADLLAAAVEISRQTGVLMILTADTTESVRQNILTRINDFESDGFVIALSEIKGADVHELLERRWHQYSGGIEFPFDKAGLVAAFADSPRPIRRVIRIIWFLMMNKVSEHYSAEPWPQGRELKFDSEEVRLKVSDLEQHLRLEP